MLAWSPQPGRERWWLGRAEGKDTQWCLLQSRNVTSGFFKRGLSYFHLFLGSANTPMSLSLQVLNS